MDEFDNFFDDQRNDNQNDSPQMGGRTPIYHTPEPKSGASKASVANIVCIVMAVIMCLAIIVNVIVLTTLKDKIAREYASEISKVIRDEYSNAISDVLDDNTKIVDDITSAATDQALKALQSSVGIIANEKSASVARLYMYKSSYANASQYDGIASGFLITDTDDSGNLQRYLVTNAHCVRYTEKKNTSIGWGGIVDTKYQWTSYSKIIAVFENDSTRYNLEIIAFGSYTDYDDQDNLIAEAENDQPDLALLRVRGVQPSNDEHPSLKIASKGHGVQRGSAVALIGNPEGIGSTNSISTGSVSQTGLTINSWGNGEFVMTDAAVNSGNSGGPMIDIQGVVVGVTESKLVDEGIDNMGFALSSSTLIDFIDWASKSQNNTLNQNIAVNYIAQE